MTDNIIFAGFGGQGILFAGKLLAYGGMIEENEVSWIPSYGPEMRGGTANCSVIVSDSPISSPVVSAPDYLVAMNYLSYEKFINSVRPGGKVFIDSSMTDERCSRTDIECFYVPATTLAHEHATNGMANIILCGKLLKESGLIKLETAKKALKEIIPKSKEYLMNLNFKALELGMSM